MDKIDSFIIYVRDNTQKCEEPKFTFIITEDDIEKRYIPIIIDYIDNLVRILNITHPEFIFTWREAHRIKPKDLKEEIEWQELLLSLGW